MRGANPSSDKVEKLGPALVPAITLLGFSVLALAWLTYRPLSDVAPQVAIFSPLMNSDMVLNAAILAGGKIVARSPLSFAIIVQSDDPAFTVRLKQSGAWLMLDASGRGVCGNLFKNDKEKRL